MNTEQILQIRASWTQVSERADELTTRFYTHLFAIDEDAAALFARVDMASQRMKLAQSLAVVVKALDDTDRLLPALGALARRHTAYGVEHRHFASVGEALLHALEETAGAGFTPELHDAWAEAYALVAAVMQRALARAGPPEEPTGWRVMRQPRPVVERPCRRRGRRSEGEQGDSTGRGSPGPA